ncbi:hypothetical protein SUGI_0113350 [Cryptomeria japonica]|uniref:uncharacterized protein LOC131054292 n=1 Tax=Cryptomeria japonica TaxID=3369 RepID=UPI002408BA85|nr:uncharacterized protein LOC131054292 [Cryptomeria japonica]GLJ09647.1 hypothetical protein SUGI_0113350 [Cryptomeria japonica]
MAMISDFRGFSMSVKRFMQRRKYERLDDFNGGRKRLRVVRLGGRRGRRIWKLKSIPKLKFRVIKSAVNVAVKSLSAKIKDEYVKLMFNLSHSRCRQPTSQVRIEEFNDKIIVEIYKSFGREVKVLPSRFVQR